MISINADDPLRPEAVRTELLRRGSQISGQVDSELRPPEPLLTGGTPLDVKLYKTYQSVKPVDAAHHASYALHHKHHGNIGQTKVVQQQPNRRALSAARTLKPNYKQGKKANADVTKLVTHKRTNSSGQPATPAPKGGQLVTRNLRNFATQQGQWQSTVMSPESHLGRPINAGDVLKVG